jgi:F420-non-reducing hydrogenase small subunit
MSGEGKFRFAMYGAASCGGCEIAVLNINEKILEVDAAFEIVLWPVVADGKYKDVEALPDQAIDLTLFNGGIRNAADEEHAHLLRRKSKVLVAFGSCATEGCVPGLANLSSPAEIFDAAYETVSTDNPEHVRPEWAWPAPEGILDLPEFQPVLRTLDQVVPVDYFMPGCPPESPQIAAVLDLVIPALRGEASLPPKGTVIGAGITTVCDECARTRNVKKIRQFRRIQEVAEMDPVLCLLEQGIPCNGPATRDGCGALCPAAGAQCIGCYGPSEGVLDYGARLIAAYASVIDAKTPEDIDRILDGIPDPAGQFYRFSLAKSLLRAGRPAWAASGK